MLFKEMVEERPAPTSLALDDLLINCRTMNPLERKSCIPGEAVFAFIQKPEKTATPGFSAWTKASNQIQTSFLVA